MTSALGAISYMLFNSFFYLLIFLPVVFISYFYLAKRDHLSAKLFLVAASLFFYGWWNPNYIPLLIFSIFSNYSISRIMLSEENPSSRKVLLIIGILINVSLLAYYKYFNFFVDNINTLLDSNFTIDKIILPLGISFFTFTQTAYLVDAFRQKVKSYEFIDYALFVSYFPHLLAGPIIHHASVMSQFENKENTHIIYKNVYYGMLLFIIGLAKKVVIADTFAILANQGFENVSSLNFTSAWLTSIAYTLQLYFDFSGYTDMAIGVSRMLNIELPINFNSPYQSLNIQDFWRRWHITLSDFLRDYIYIPIGGNRVSAIRVYFNLLATFLVGGIWHGAGWTYIIWGMLHGVALCIHRIFSTLGLTLPKVIAWTLTFMFVNIAWIFFRSNSVYDAIYIIKCLTDLSSASAVNLIQLSSLAFGLLIVTQAPNSNNIIKIGIFDKYITIPIPACLLVLSIISMEISSSHEFIYFQF